MKILLLSCSTGEGHNHCALAVKEALDARGHETSFPRYAAHVRAPPGR